MQAIAAEGPAMEDLLVRLVEAPTLLGDEAPGQAIMREAFADLGLDPVDVPLDPEALHGHPGASPFSWEVEGKASVVAAWEPAGPAGGRSLVLNGHIDVVSPEPTVMWASPPFAARRDGDWLYGRGAGDMKAGLAAIVGAVRGPASLWGSRRAPGWNCSPWSRRSAAVTARWGACWRATPPTPRSSPSPPAGRFSTRRWACSGSV